jgi:hypothetical protein
MMVQGEQSTSKQAAQPPTTQRLVRVTVNLTVLLTWPSLHSHRPAPSFAPAPGVIVPRVSVTVTVTATAGARRNCNL